MMPVVRPTDRLDQVATQTFRLLDAVVEQPLPGDAMAKLAADARAAVMLAALAAVALAKTTSRERTAVENVVATVAVAAISTGEPMLVGTT